MLRLFKRTANKVGLPPGSLVHIGDKRIEKVKITIIDYDEMRFEEREVDVVEKCYPFKDTPTVTWINIDGIHEADTIEKIGKHYDIHPLVLEDIMNSVQRPKMEDLEHYVFVILKMLFYDEKAREILSEQVSLILGSNFVITFQEKEGDVFNPVRDRLRMAKGRIRKMKADYLAYCLLDTIVDHYFIVLEKMGEGIESLEEELVADPTPETLQTIHILKRELIFLRRSVWPLREAVTGLERGESVLIHESTGIYLRDVYDHTIQIIDTIETFRDMVSGMLDVYLSSISNKMNEVMKVLTIIATIFIPLTFIAGIYGMNFEYIPELKWHWGYIASLFLMGIIALIMVLYFRRKRWL
jgi:magnesium transporter